MFQKMYEYLNSAVCINQDRTGGTCVKGTKTSQQYQYLRNIINLNLWSQEYGHKAISGIIQAYIQRMSSWRFRVMYLAALSCTTHFKVASAVDSVGLHDRLTSIPSIISCGPTSNSSISQQLAACCKKKLKLFLKSWLVNSCVAQMSIQWYLCSKFREVYSSHVQNVLHEDHVQKMLFTNISFHSPIIRWRPT